MNLESLLRFPNLSKAAFQHPDDKAAGDLLSKIPVFPLALKWVYSETVEHRMRLQRLAKFIRVTPRQAGSIHSLFVRAAEILDLPELPELYISPELGLNAYSIGVKQHAVILHTDLVSTLAPDELMAVIGHELGHVKCDHMANMTLAYFILDSGHKAASAITSKHWSEELASAALQLALLAWSRRAELSCDRAALLVTQDPAIVMRALARLAGLPRCIPEPLDVDEALRQFSEFTQYGAEGKPHQVMKALDSINSMAGDDHPNVITRIGAIHGWSQSDQYKDILAGEYLAVTETANRVERSIL